MKNKGVPVRAVAGSLSSKSVDRVGDQNANVEYDQADNRGVK